MVSELKILQKFGNLQFVNFCCAVFSMMIFCDVFKYCHGTDTVQPYFGIEMCILLSLLLLLFVYLYVSEQYSRIG